MSSLWKKGKYAIRILRVHLDPLSLSALLVNSFLRWTSEDQSRDVCLEYPNISIHGICRDTTVFPHSCVYVLHSVPIGTHHPRGTNQRCMPTFCIESDLEKDEEGEEVEDGGEEEAPLTKTEEVRFVPSDEHQCKNSCLGCPALF